MNARLIAALCCIIAASLLLAFCAPAQADIITEFGIGYKLPSSSYLLMPQCKQAVVVNPPDDPRYPDAYSCGGSFPAFIGWPVAWESDFRGAWKVRVGWFHYSNWFDGGRSFETHMDVAAATATFNWSEWRRRK